MFQTNRKPAGPVISPGLRDAYIRDIVRLLKQIRTESELQDITKYIRASALEEQKEVE